jgi:hypothetical protein
MRWRRSYSETMTAMIRFHAQGKGWDKTEEGYPEGWEVLCEEEINDMPNAELIDLMESAGVVRVVSQ